MNYFSLNYQAPKVSFKEAVIRGLAPDKGLYFPAKIQSLPPSFFRTMDNMDASTMCYEAIKQFVGDDIPVADLKQIVEQAISFGFPLVELEKNVAALELHHGPTLAFKDVGARFMALCLGYFTQSEKTGKSITVLVATSGDTGSAVAHGFNDVKGTEVVILYPSGKVSEIQEKQLTTLGGNITAIEVDGTFDDCQQMVKQAFTDPDLKNCSLTSANSINIARWLPQMFYFILTYKEVQNRTEKLVVSVPSGNYGNICAGMMAQKLGLPITHFVAGNNANDVVPRYLQSGNYNPREAIPTISNAMDVGDPSNFIRIRHLHDNDLNKLRNNLSAYSFSDQEARQAIQYLWSENKYLTDPHGAIAYLALKQFLSGNKDYYGVFLETAHPAKFIDVLPKNLISKIQIPEAVNEVLSKEKRALKMETYQQLKELLLERA